MWLLVTGTGRCGTGYVSQLLTSAGVNCTHEGVFNLSGWDDALDSLRLRRKNPSWGWEADASWLATPFLDRPEMGPLTVVQLVRHPKRVIDSHLRLMLYRPGLGPYYKWMTQHIPAIEQYDTPEDRAAYWYLRLNELCEKRANLRHRIEDGDTDLLDKLGIQYDTVQLFNNTAYNARVGLGPSDIALGDISPPLRDELVEMCERYGYRWDDAKGATVNASWIRGIKVPIPETAGRIGGGWQLRDAIGNPVAYDAPLIEFFAQKVAQVPGAVVIDGGASTGSFSVMPLIADCTILAFEPNPTAARDLRRIIELNALGERVKIREAALGDKGGTVMLRVPIDAIHMAVATTGTPRPRGFAWRDVEVEQVQIDDLNLGRVDFIKIDTEGAELQVLAGAEQTIKRHKPGILTEYTSLNTRQCGYEREEIKATLKRWEYTHFQQVGIEDLWCEP